MGSRLRRYARRALGSRRQHRWTHALLISGLCACGGRAVIENGGGASGSPDANTSGAGGTMGGNAAAGGNVAIGGNAAIAESGTSGTMGVSGATACPASDSAPAAFLGIVGAPCAPSVMSCVGGPVACTCEPPANHTDLEWDCIVVPGALGMPIGCPGNPASDAALQTIEGLRCTTLGEQCRPLGCGVLGCACNDDGAGPHWDCATTPCR